MKIIIILLFVATSVMVAIAQQYHETPPTPASSQVAIPTDSVEKALSGIKNMIIQTIKNHASRIQNLEAHASKHSQLPQQLATLQKQQSNIELSTQENTKAIRAQRQFDTQTQIELAKLENDFLEIGRDLDSIQLQIVNLITEDQNFQLAQAFLRHRQRKGGYTRDLNHIYTESENLDFLLSFIDATYWSAIVLSLSSTTLSMVLFSLPYWPTWDRRVRQLLKQYRRNQKNTPIIELPFQTPFTDTLKQPELDLGVEHKPQSGSDTKVSTLDDIQIKKPATLLEELVAQATGISTDAFLNAPWKTGSACIKGKVRDENQDYALAFSFGSFQVGVVADGMGGLEHGRQASYLAVRAATKAILKDLNSNPNEDTLLTTCHAAVDAASKELADISQRYGISPNSGLRTTFVLCIGSQNYWTLFYSGDGGAVLLQKDGTVVDLLKPQRDDPNQPNLLSGSLGPDVAGIPVPAVHKRQLGDLMILGSDGVFERVSNQFPQDVLKCAFQYRGNLEEATKALIESMSKEKDRHGYICDDNLSLVCISDGRSPQLKPSFHATLFDLKAPFTHSTDTLIPTAS